MATSGKSFGIHQHRNREPRQPSTRECVRYPQTQICGGIAQGCLTAASPDGYGRSAVVMVEWQEQIEIAIGPSGGDALEGQGQPGEGIDVVHLCGLQKGSDGRPRRSAAVGSGEQRILARDGNLGVILPMLGWRSKSIIAGIRISDAGFAARTAKNAPTVGSFISSSCLGMSLPLRPG